MNDYAPMFRERDSRKAYTNRHRYLAIGVLVGFICGIALAATYIGGTV